MTHRRPARSTTRRARLRRLRLACLLAAVAAVAAVLGHQLLASSASPSATAAFDVLRDAPPADSTWPAQRQTTLRSGPPGLLGEADGVVREGATVFDDELPAVANLDPDLLAALRRAAIAAAADWIELEVTSGWRSAAYQERLLQEAVSKYGSEAEAARWVATAETSPHVSGDAVDVGPSAAREWLSRRGAEYGLCQIYGNEPWHYELRPEAVENGCPPLYPDPTHDPRMRR